MSSNQQLLKNLYEAFNAREIETIISSMRPDVKWANGMEGGFVYGRHAVREYWLKQFETMRPHLEPLEFDVDGNGRNVVTVHIIIRDLKGDLMLEKTVPHTFTIENDLISLFEIGDTEPVQKAIENVRTSSGQ